VRQRERRLREEHASHASQEQDEQQQEEQVVVPGDDVHGAEPHVLAHHRPAGRAAAQLEARVVRPSRCASSSCRPRRTSRRRRRSRWGPARGATARARSRRQGSRAARRGRRATASRPPRRACIPTRPRRSERGDRTSWSAGAPSPGRPATSTISRYAVRIPCAPAGSRDAVVSSTRKRRRDAAHGSVLLRRGTERRARRCGGLVAAHGRAVDVHVVALEGLLEEVRDGLVSMDDGVLEPDAVEDVVEAAGAPGVCCSTLTRCHPNRDSTGGLHSPGGRAKTASANASP
jgi:hypothetical protein